MKNTKYSFTSNRNRQPHSGSQATAAPPVSKCGPKPVAPPGIRTTARDYANPVDYQHPYPSMAQFADLLALRYDANRTRHSYYRQRRLVHQHCQCDPATITEAQLRQYFLFVKLKKHWKPKSIRQALASARVFFVELLSKPDWTLFAQIRAQDHDTLPAVLTRQQVQALLGHIRLRRYRTPLKLIYCCGLRLSECLGLTIHDIRGKENQLLIRHSKGDNYAKVVVMQRGLPCDRAEPVFVLYWAEGWTRRKAGEVYERPVSCGFRLDSAAVQERLGSSAHGRQLPWHNPEPLRGGFARARIHPWRDTFSRPGS